MDRGIRYCPFGSHCIGTEMVDGLAGALAALLVVSLSWYRMLSIMLMSQLPVLFFGLIMFWAWLRWRSGSRRPGWLLLIGICAGWAAITRPLDAMCFALPIGVAILLDIRFGAEESPSSTGSKSGSESPGRKHRRWWVALALIILGAAPFLAVQALL